jgi:phosphoglycolate phosphatase-like HAD superfamily hydrolase
MSGTRRAVLFDLDGTLINTFRLYMECFRLTLEPHFSRRLTDAEILSLHPHAEQRLLFDIVPETDFTPFFERFLTYYATLHEGLFGGPYEGVPEMLHALQARGCLLGIVSGKSRDAWRITATRMEAEGFEDFFDVVLTDDDVQAPKPSPEGLLLAVDALDLLPTQAVFVGDSLLDHQAAQAAGIPFGAALWSRGEDGRAVFAQPVGPEHGGPSFRRPADVIGWVMKE